MISSGINKTIGIEGIIGFFGSIGLPAYTAYLVSYGELFAGIALLLGLYSRLASLLLLVILVGALYMHVTAIMTPVTKPLFLSFLAVSIVITGPGFLAIKRLPGLDKVLPSFLRDR